MCWQYRNHALMLGPTQDSTPGTAGGSPWRCELLFLQVIEKQTALPCVPSRCLISALHRAAHKRLHQDSCASPSGYLLPCIRCLKYLAIKMYLAVRSFIVFCQQIFKIFNPEMTGIFIGTILKSKDKLSLPWC